MTRSVRGDSDHREWKRWGVGEAGGGPAVFVLAIVAWGLLSLVKGTEPSAAHAVLWMLLGMIALAIVRIVVRGILGSVRITVEGERMRIAPRLWIGMKREFTCAKTVCRVDWMHITGGRFRGYSSATVTIVETERVELVRLAGLPRSSVERLKEVLQHGGARLVEQHSRRG